MGGRSARSKTQATLVDAYESCSLDPGSSPGASTIRRALRFAKGLLMTGHSTGS